MQLQSELQIERMQIGPAASVGFGFSVAGSKPVAAIGSMFSLRLMMMPRFQDSGPDLVHQKGALELQRAVRQIGSV